MTGNSLWVADKLIGVKCDLSVLSIGISLAWDTEHLVYVPTGHSWVFFGENTLQVLHPLRNLIPYQSNAWTTVQNCVLSLRIPRDKCWTF